MYKKYTLTIAAILFLAIGFGQGVVISTSSSVPDASAMLDVQSNTKGFLVPRMTQTERDAIAAPATGLLIYQSDNTPGFYYNSGTPAAPVWTSLQASAWNLTGNSGTTPATHFIGALDNTTVLFKTNNTERFRMTNNGQVIINGTTARSPQDGLEVLGTGVPGAIGSFNYPVNGYSAGSYAGVYGQNTASGQGVLGENNGTGMGVYGVASVSGIGVAGIATNNFGITGQTVSGSYAGIKGTNTNASGIGIIGLGNGITTFNNLGNGAGVLAQGEYFGVTAFASTSTAAVANEKWGGYFDYLPSGNGFAYVGGRHAGTDYAILSTGVKSTMVKDEQNRNRIMYCTEAPEVLFQDYGTSQLVNGRVHVTIDPLLARNIYVSADKPLKVFIQLEGDCNGVYVTNKTASGFDVIELQNGTSNTPFTYQLVANRANATDQNGQVLSNYADTRFPVGPNRVQGSANTPPSRCLEIPVRCTPANDPRL